MGALKNKMHLLGLSALIVLVHLRTQYRPLFGVSYMIHERNSAWVTSMSDGTLAKVNTRSTPNVGLMSSQRRRQRANIEQSLCGDIVFSGQ